MLGETAIFGLTAVVLAGLMTSVLCHAFIRVRMGLDPVSERSNHKSPTPRLGGLAVLGGLSAAVLVLYATNLLSQDALVLMVLTFVGGAIGLVDDFFDAPVGLRLIVMTVIAVVAPIFLGPVLSVPLPVLGWVPIPQPLGVLLAAFWVLSIMNVFNFMDGLNGLAGSFAVVVIAAVSMVWLEPSWPLLVMQVAILGFLFCNVFDGKIFLGDAGSLSIGTLMGVAPLMSGGEGTTFWIVPLVCLPLILDVAVTLVRRAIRGARLYEPHREHLYQQVKAAGWSHQASSSAVVLTGAAGAIIACLLWPLASAEPLVYWLCALLVGLGWAATMRALLILKRKPSNLEGALR